MTQERRLRRIAEKDKEAMEQQLILIQEEACLVNEALVSIITSTNIFQL